VTARRVASRVEKCWARDPLSRPPFAETLAALRRLRRGLERGLPGSANDEEDERKRETTRRCRSARSSRARPSRPPWSSRRRPSDETTGDDRCLFDRVVSFRFQTGHLSSRVRLKRFSSHKLVASPL
jgi:hypothetical protein